MYFFSTVVCFVPCSVWKEKITYLQFLKWMKPWTKLMKGSGLIGLMEVEVRLGKWRGGVGVGVGLSYWRSKAGLG